MPAALQSVRHTCLTACQGKGSRDEACAQVQLSPSPIQVSTQSYTSAAYQGGRGSASMKQDRMLCAKGSMSVHLEGATYHKSCTMHQTNCHSAHQPQAASKASCCNYFRCSHRAQPEALTGRQGEDCHRPFDSTQAYLSATTPATGAQKKKGRKRTRSTSDNATLESFSLQSEQRQLSTECNAHLGEKQ